jgi:hypothetical protein
MRRGCRSLQGVHASSIRQTQVSLLAYVYFPEADDNLSGVTMAQVKLQLANEEASKTGFDTTAPHTPSTFIILGLELEGLQ